MNMASICLLPLIHFKYPPLLPEAITEQGHAVGWLAGKYPNSLWL